MLGYSDFVFQPFNDKLRGTKNFDPEEGCDWERDYESKPFLEDENAENLAANKPFSKETATETVNTLLETTFEAPPGENVSKVPCPNALLLLRMNLPQRKMTQWYLIHFLLRPLNPFREEISRRCPIPFLLVRMNLPRRKMKHKLPMLLANGNLNQTIMIFLSRLNILKKDERKTTRHQPKKLEEKWRAKSQTIGDRKVRSIVR